MWGSHSSGWATASDSYVPWGGFLLQGLCCPCLNLLRCWGHLSLSDTSIVIYTRILAGLNFAILLFFVFCQEMLGTCVKSEM